ncbi:fungal-specific transcription factor domain-containing protein [Acrodontium crateriforme]|uniref:Fungal-specific transcription factor domain-containing protein n=1 Tax=Acrodontium crateriforme TaxID=150365 RepID=A0AAQ3M4Y1_9PEZI|nr:fungal-specific transcription factor domain-containing protein [Acrodontium crateriforme]
MALMAAAKPGASTPCWECRRRRLLCDGTWPKCRKCATALVNCPGYERRNRPLRWLQPGQIIARRSPKNDSTLALANKGESQTSAEVEVVPRGDVDETMDLHTMDLVELDKKPLRSDIQDAAEAAFYYCAQVSPYEFPCELKPHITTNLITPEMLTEASRHLLIVTMLHHRSIQATGSKTMEPHSMMNLRTLEYKQLAIATINRHLNNELTRIGDEVLFDIWYSAITEILISSKPRWIIHYRAMYKIIDLRGGLATFIRTTAWSHAQILQMLLHMLSIEVTTNSSLLVPMVSRQDTKHWLSILHSGKDEISSFPCPLPLLLNIVEINTLRRERHILWRSAAVDIITRLRDAPIQEWIDSKDVYRKEWSAIIRIFHASVSLFALNTLSNPALPSWTVPFRRSQRKLLFSLLPKAWKMTTLKCILNWSAVIAGFEAAKGTKADRVFVEDFLGTMGREMGAATPFHAQAVLRRFWASGKTEWDECFDDTYSFSM